MVKSFLSIENENRSEVKKTLNMRALSLYLLRIEMKVIRKAYDEVPDEPYHPA